MSENKIVGRVPERAQAAIAELRLALARGLFGHEEYTEEYEAILNRSSAAQKDDCPRCDGEGGYETGIICGHRCDGCKGCVGYKACEFCDGFGEVEWGAQ